MAARGDGWRRSRRGEALRRGAALADERIGHHRDTADRVDVAALRTGRPDGWLEGHFCGRCHCGKSGWADVSNMVFDWCDDQACPCHREDESGWADVSNMVFDWCDDQACPCHREDES